MKRRYGLLGIVFVVLILVSTPVLAHVPYLELQDFSEERPFKVRKSIEQSLAVYSWLEREQNLSSDDIDVYQFTVRKTVRVYIQALVPVCAEYADFAPWFALVGPELPPPEEDIPFDLPSGYGAFVINNTEPGENRTSFYEPFGGKSYYEGPVFDQNISKKGTYYIYFWDPYEIGGDYVAVLGRREIFGLFDIFRALIFTPLIRRNMELHVNCTGTLQLLL